MTGPGENLFNFMADKLREFLIAYDILHKKHFLGFTFSFPTLQHSLKSADLATWTKVRVTIILKLDLQSIRSSPAQETGSSRCAE